MNYYEELLFTTLLIECTGADGIPSDYGTGFLLSGNSNENGKEHVYLVSNRHVFKDVDDIRLSITSNGDGKPLVGQYISFGLTDLKKNVVFHPDDEIDLAVLEITGLITSIMPDALFVRILPVDILEPFSSDSIHAADRVYFIGYPEDRGDHKNNLPLIREGIIASHPMYDYNGKPVFVVDAQIFPGSSGSPVFVKSTIDSYYENDLLVANERLMLAGVISETFQKTNTIKLAEAKETAVPEVIGLGTVVKATEIRKLIDSIEINKK